MPMLEMMRFSFREMRRARARTLATLAVGAIGTASLAIALTYAADARIRALDQIRRLGVRLIAIAPAPQRQAGPARRAVSRPLILTAASAELLPRQIPWITRATPLLVRSARLKVGDRSRTITVVGCKPQLFEMRQWPFLEGARWSDAEEGGASRVAVLGAGVVQEFFPNLTAIGAAIRLDGVRFVVRGVLVERGEGVDGTNEDEQIWIPLSAAMRRLFRADRDSAVVAEVDSEDNAEGAAVAATSLLARRNHISASAIRVRVQKEAADTIRDTSDNLTVWVRLIAVAGGVLAGGGSLMLLWSEIADRARDLAVLRAIGASRRQIAGQLMIESIAAAVFATAAGMGMAAAVWLPVARRVQFPPALDVRAVALASSAAIICQIAAAAFATRNAMQQEVADGLRSW